MAWAETVGIRAYVCDNDYTNQTETLVFAHVDGFVYRMENNNSFDGANIIASFATPFVHINDPRVRKTFYKMVLYLEPKGGVTVSANLKFDFDTAGSVQPETISLTNESGVVSLYGNSSAVYGSALYGARLKKQLQTQLIGSGFSVSLQFVSEGQNPPFSLDAATIEFSTHDRR
jgi:hypothetical protein